MRTQSPFPKVLKPEEMVFYQVEREFRKPKSRLADWGIMFSDVIKSSWKREAEAWERPGFGGPRSKDKGLQAYPLLGGRGDKREVFGGVQWKESRSQVGRTQAGFLEETVPARWGRLGPGREGTAAGTARAARAAGSGWR